MRDVEGDTVVLDRAAERIHRLNSTAGFIWQRCDGRRTVGDIAEELAGAFDVAPGAANEAVVAAIRQLDELGLLDHTLG